MYKSHQDSEHYKNKKDFEHENKANLRFFTCSHRLVVLQSEWIEKQKLQLEFPLLPAFNKKKEKKNQDERIYIYIYI